MMFRMFDTKKDAPHYHGKYDAETIYSTYHIDGADQKTVRAASSGRKIDNELLAAVMNNNYIKIKALIEDGANPNAVTAVSDNRYRYSQQFCAMELAISQGCVDSVAVLLKYNASVPSGAIQQATEEYQSRKDYPYLGKLGINAAQITERMVDLLNGQITPENHFADIDDSLTPSRTLT